MGILSAVARRGAAQRIPYRAIFPNTPREPIGWQHFTPPPRWKQALSYLEERNNGPMAMGMASLDPRLQSLPFDMGLAAMGGGAGVMALNQLAMQQPERAERNERRRLTSRLSELRRALRDQDMIEYGYMTGLEDANDQLALDVHNMNDMTYQERAYERRR